MMGNPGSTGFSYNPASNNLMLPMGGGGNVSGGVMMASGYPMNPQNPQGRTNGSNAAA
jgi:hypothetical protein